MNNVSNQLSFNGICINIVVLIGLSSVQYWSRVTVTKQERFDMVNQCETYV